MGSLVSVDPVTNVLTIYAAPGIFLRVFGGAFATQSTLYVKTTTQAAAYTLTLNDANSLIEYTGGSAIAFTIPNNTTVAFPNGTVISVCQAGAGTVTLSPASGVTLDSPFTNPRPRTRWSQVSIRKRNANEWVISGDAT